jgi:hypothetical protein
MAADISNAAQAIDFRDILFQIRMFRRKYDFSWADLFTAPLDCPCFGVIV